MVFSVYALKSETRTYIYVGLTNNLDKRVYQHQSGANKTTKPYRPFKLIFYQSFNTRPEARAKEIYLKSGAGKEFLKSLI